MPHIGTDIVVPRTDVANRCERRVDEPFFHLPMSLTDVGGPCPTSVPTSVLLLAMSVTDVGEVLGLVGSDVVLPRPT